MFSKEAGGNSTKTKRGQGGFLEDWIRLGTKIESFEKYAKSLSMNVDFIFDLIFAFVGNNISNTTYWVFNIIFSSWN